MFGLNLGTALQIPDVLEHHRKHNREQNAGRMLRPGYGVNVPGQPGRKKAPEFHRSRWNAEANAGAAMRRRRYTKKGILGAMSALRDELGRPIRASDMKCPQPGGARLPKRHHGTSVVRHLGTRLCPDRPRTTCNAAPLQKACVGTG
jgi:hypothetical protein